MRQKGLPVGLCHPLSAPPAIIEIIIPSVPPLRPGPGSFAWICDTSCQGRDRDTQICSIALKKPEIWDLRLGWL
ncbi:hypothetical protein D3C76_1545380 [compost metagenome]